MFYAVAWLELVRLGPDQVTAAVWEGEGSGGVDTREGEGSGGVDTREGEGLHSALPGHDDAPSWA